VVQQKTTLESQRRVLAAMLGTFCGIEVNHVAKPAAADTVSGNNRPELRLIDSQLRLTDAQDRALKAALLPRLGVFAQGYYGYPGYNMFKDMMGRDWSWNGMVGARLTWNIGALYTHHNDKAKVQLQRETAQNQREVFLFNNRMEQMQQNEAIGRYRQLMAQDEEIIALREQVRKAAESKLSHGIIDVNDLLRDINSENAARVQQSIHEIEMLKQMYDLKYSTNN
ncbi:MAG: TolC family protein, partial [Muribaculaceae bacterium]|nr:TolC family protein [Muribaculaceae bacterium]